MDSVRFVDILPSSEEVEVLVGATSSTPRRVGAVMHQPKTVMFNTKVRGD